MIITNIICSERLQKPMLKLRASQNERSDLVSRPHVRGYYAVLTTLVAMLVLVVAPAPARAQREFARPAVLLNMGILYNTPNPIAACADIPGYGSGTIDGPVNIWYCNRGSADNQDFFIDFRGYVNGEEVYQIRSLNQLPSPDYRTVCLDLPGYGWVPQATKVSLYPCNWGDPLNDNQAWHFRYQFRNEYLGVTAYRIVNAKNGLCLDVPGNRNFVPDVQLEVFPCQDLDIDDHDWGVWED